MGDPAIHAGPERARPDEDGTDARARRRETSCIRENLLRLRLDREWTQAQLAARAGLSRAAIGQIERGEVIPKILTLAALAVALRTSLGDLALPVRPLRGVRFCDPPSDVGARIRGSVRRTAGAGPALDDPRGRRLDRAARATLPVRPGTGGFPSADRVKQKAVETRSSTSSRSRVGAVRR